MREWLDFIKLIRLTTNPTLLRSILLSSFTIGIPSYKVEFNVNDNGQMLIDMIRLETKNNDALEQPLDSSDNYERDDDLATVKEAREDVPILFDNKNVEFQDAASFSEVYESLVDGLLDLNETSIDLSTLLPYNDSMNLMLVSRCIELIDLVSYLNDDLAFEKCMFQLSTRIYEIVNRVKILIIFS